MFRTLYKYSLISLLLGTSTLSLAADKDAQKILESIDIPYEKFTLDNGLRVIVHSDHNVPVVNVSVWYHVGSKDEPVGRTGFAHLFEHLMFNGSKNYTQDFMQGLKGTGASNINGNTTADRTLYYETVPTNVLDRTLWLESDRMASLNITQALLEEQRAVVKNEKRQQDNNLYGPIRNIIQAGVFPEGHPYNHTPIGAMDDLNAATLDDVKSWYSKYYGATNTVLVLAGDITVEKAKELTQKYFSHVPVGTEIHRIKEQIPNRVQPVYEEKTAKIKKPEINRIWVAPSRGDKESLLLQVATSYLTGGKDAPLVKALVDTKLAKSVRFVVKKEEIASQVSLDISFNDLTKQSEVEQIIRDELNAFIKNGMSKKALAKIKKRMLLGVARSLESLPSKRTMLAEAELYSGDPSFYKTKLQWLVDITPEDLSKVVDKWLGNNFYQLTLKPKNKKLTVKKDQADRSAIPEIGKPAKLVFPEVQEAQLDNGMKVVFVERNTVPFVQVRWTFEGGTLAEVGYPAGTSQLTGSLFKVENKNYDQTELAEELAELGSSINVNAAMEWFTVSSTMPTTEIDDTLEIAADVLQTAKFPAKELEKKRAKMLDNLRSPNSKSKMLKNNLLRKAIYGESHPYGIQNNRMGTEKDILAVTRDDLVNYYQSFIRPENGTIFVAGDTTLAEILPKLNDTFGDWEVDAKAKPVPKMPMVSAPEKAKVYLVNKPNAGQTKLSIGMLAPSKIADDRLPYDTFVSALGGGFTSRLSQNLREDKGWSYSARARSSGRQGQRLMTIGTSVQTDKTKESIIEIQKELTQLATTKPVSQSEADAIIAKRLASLPASLSTTTSLLNSMLGHFQMGEPINGVTLFEQRYSKVTLEAVQEAINKHVDQKQMIWVIQGDLSKIEKDVRALALGDVEVIDVDKL